MARQTSITFNDDLDGSKAAETVQFELDGVRYEIDLSSKNANSIRKTLAQFVAASRPLKTRMRRDTFPAVLKTAS